MEFHLDVLRENLLIAWMRDHHHSIRAQHLLRNRISMKQSLLAPILFLSFTAAHILFSADSTSFYGIGTHFGQFSRSDMTGGNMTAQLDLIAAAGFTAIRDECYWSDVEQQRGVYTFPAQVDAYIAAAHARGLQVLLLLNYNNPLYAPHAGSQMTTDSNRAAYVRYCEEVVKRYAPLGVKHFELWNEPNLPMFWDPVPNASDYVKMVKAAYPAIKKIDSTVTVIGCATSPLEGQPAPNIPWTNFITGVVKDSGLQYMDAVSFHQYRVDKIPETWLAADVQTGLQLIGNARPLWLTEVGYHTASVWPFTSLTVQADNMVRLYLLGLGHPSLRRISVYDFKNDGTEPANPEHNFGIVNFDRTPKPAYLALKTLFGSIRNRGYQGLTVTGGNYTASFGTHGTMLKAVWNPTATVQRTLSVGSRDYAIVERDGARTLYIGTDTNATVQYSPSPRYVIQLVSAPSLRSVRIEPKNIIIDTSQSVSLRLSGEDSLANPAVIAAARAEWSVIAGSGSIDASGTFRSHVPGTVKVRGMFNGRPDTATVTVFVPTGSRGMNGFSDSTQWGFSVQNLDSIASSFTIASDRASEGASSGKLFYRFKHKEGLGVSSYKAVLQTDIPIPGNPDSLMIDIFGNGSPHRIEFRFRDLYGEYFSKTAADQPVFWNSVWKPVRIWMKGFGANVDYPITLDRIVVYTVPSLLIVDSIYTGTIYLDDLRARFTSVLGTSLPLSMPEQFRLSQNYPNPFNPATTIAYTLPQESMVRLSIYNTLGQLVDVPLNERQSAGRKEIRWQKELASGLYFYRLEAEGISDNTRRVDIKKMTVLK
jgi:hypothetical protein